MDIPPPPKRPMSAYFLYAKDRRPTLKKEQPELKATEITSKMGAEWNELSAEARSKYTAIWTAGKEAYEKEITEYTKKYPNWKETQKKNKAAGKAPKASRTGKAAKLVTVAAIKKKKSGPALSGFSLFGAAMRMAYLEKKGSRMPPVKVDALARMWKNMDGEAKDEWAARAGEVGTLAEAVGVEPAVDVEG